MRYCFINGVPVDNFIINCYEDYMTSANWQDEFDQNFVSGGGFPVSITESCEVEPKDVKAFIQTLLDKQKEEILEKLTLEQKGEAFMRDEALMCGGYNQAVSDLEELKKTLYARL